MSNVADTTPSNPVDFETANTHRHVPENSCDDTVAHDASPVDELMSSLPDELTEVQRAVVKELLESHADVFSKGEMDVGRTHLISHRIDTGTTRPIRQGLRRHPIAHLEIIDKHVDAMLKSGIVEPAASPWAANVVLVKRKDGQYRFCVDYRAVNSCTYKDTYPLPHIDMCLDALGGASWFSTLDLRAGYHNVPIHEDDRDKTAFITRRGCFRYTVMPFGLTCAPSVFQRLMDLVLSGLAYETCLVYLDDIIIFAKTFEEMVERLGTILGRLRWARLKLKCSKCCLFRRQVSFLGHVVSTDGIAMQPEKISAIRDWPTPVSIHECRVYLGLCSYYRRFIDRFSDVAAPLYELICSVFHIDSSMTLPDKANALPPPKY